MSKLYLFLTIPLLINISESARILGVVPTPSYSHQIVFRPVWRELARRGHEVVVITTDPENDPTLNITEIDISFAYQRWVIKYNFIKVFEEHKNNPIKLFSTLGMNFLRICEDELASPQVQSLITNKTEHFDLLIIEYLYPVMFGFAKRFNCPYIGLTSLDIPNLFHSLLGNPDHPVAYPDFLTPFAAPLNFWERLGSVLFTGIVKLYSRYNYGHSLEQQIMEEKFGMKMPRLLDIMKNVSMVFINVNPAFNVRPLGPAIITIGGGTHLEKPKNLPKDLQDYLDSAKNGAIYFSLGTNVKSDRVSPQMRKVMLDTFKDLPYKVLWKFDVTDLPDVPKNVKIVKWLPQQDILRHPNVKVFITQGGLQSMEEAIFSNVPLVGIPFIGDQDTNVQKMVKKGFGVYLNKDRLTQEIFREAILEVLNNPKYKERTIEIAELSKDQPMTGLEKAIWWTEYVLRHKGAPHFRNPVMDMPLYQYYLLDVIGVVFGTIFVVFYVSYKIFVCIKNFVFRKLVSKPPKSKVN